MGFFFLFLFLFWCFCFWWLEGCHFFIKQVRNELWFNYCSIINFFRWVFVTLLPWQQKISVFLECRNFFYSRYPFWFFHSHLEWKPSWLAQIFTAGVDSPRRRDAFADLLRWGLFVEVWLLVWLLISVITCAFIFVLFAAPSIRAEAACKHLHLWTTDIK